MKKLIFMIFVGCVGFASCTDSREVLVPIPNDVTLNELQLEHKVIFNLKSSDV